MTDLNDFDVQELAGLVGIWVTPASEGQEPVVSLEFCNQQKRYAKVWLREPDTVDWGWALNDKAICLWRDPDESD